MESDFAAEQTTAEMAAPATIRRQRWGISWRHSMLSSVHRLGERHVHEAIKLISVTG
jgi:hypothetical protein